MEFKLWMDHNLGFGVGVLPIAADTGRFLVCFRSPWIKYPNTWAVWGGAAESHDLQSEVIRELKEETRYTGPIKLIPGHVYNKGYVFHNFLGIVPMEFTPVLNSESSAFRWVNYNQLSRLPEKHFGLSEFIKESRGLILNTLNEVEKGSNKKK